MGKHFEEYHINGNTYRLHVFDKIECNEEAYLIGYLFGDGNFNDKNNSKKKRKSRMGIGSIDRELMYQIRDYFCPDSKINSHIPVNKVRNIKSKILSYKFTFSSKFSDAFERFGLLCMKPDRKIVNIPKKFMMSFTLGLFDADGHISFGNRKDRNRLWAHIGFTHPSFYVLSSLQRYFETEMHIASSIRQRPNENVMDLRFASLDSVYYYVKSQYKNKPLFYSDVKYNRCMKFVDMYEYKNNIKQYDKNTSSDKMPPNRVKIDKLSVDEYINNISPSITNSVKSIEVAERFRD